MPCLTPVDRVIAAFGGVSALSEATEIPHKRIYRWRAAAGKGGCDGRVPSQYQGPILEAARDRGVGLTPADLVAATSGVAMSVAAPAGATS